MCAMQVAEGLPPLTEETLRAAVATQLEAGSHDTARREAQQWLRALQNAPAGWMAAQMLLQRPQQQQEGGGGREAATAAAAMAAVDVRQAFYGANLAYNKIKYDFHELSQEDVAQWFQSCVALLGEYAAYGTEARAVITRICMALAQLVVQVNQAGALNSLLAEMNPLIDAAPEVILQQLTVLPQEGSAARVDSATRRNFQDELRSSVNEMLAFLQAQMSAPGGPSMAVQVQVLKCLAAWVESCRFRPDEWAQNPLLIHCFDALQEDELFEPATDVIINTVREHGCASTAMTLAQMIFPRVLQLQDMYRTAVRDGDDETAQGLCRLFTETGEAYVDLILTTDSMGQDVFFDTLLECTVHPSSAVSLIPNPLWWRIAYNANNMSNEQDSQLRIALVRQLQPTYQRLLHVCVEKCQYPANAEDLSGADMDDLRHQRREFSDTVKDCAAVLGVGGTFAELCALLRQVVPRMQEAWAHFQQQQPEQQQSHRVPPEIWSEVEAVLFAVRAISGRVDARLPVEYGFGDIVALLRELPPHPFIKCTANDICGRAAAWFDGHGDQLEPTFLTIVNSLEPESAETAARAIAELCERRRTQLGEPVLDLYDHLCELRGHLRLEHELDILRGLCVVASSLTLDRCTVAMYRFLEPLMQHLRELLPPLAPAQDAAANAQSEQEVVAAAHAMAPEVMAQAVVASRDLADPIVFVPLIERITTVFRHVRPSMPAAPGAEGEETHPVLTAFSHLWPPLQTVVLLYPENRRIAEKVCRCYKYVIRTTHLQFAHVLEPFAHHITERFRVAPTTPYIYAGSILVSIFGDVEALGNLVSQEQAMVWQQLLYGMFSEFSRTVFEILPDLDAFEQRPDVAEEFFFLVVRFLEKCPDPLLLAPEFRDLLATLVQAATAGVRVQHREAQKGVLQFFNRLFRLGVHTRGLDHGWQQGIAQDRINVVRAIVATNGADLVNGFIRCLAGETPAYALDESHGCFSDVLYHFLSCAPREQAEAWFFEALQSLPPPLISDEGKRAFWEQLVDSHNRQMDPAFSDAVREFHATCSMNARKVT